MTVSNRCIKVTYDIIGGRGETKVPRLFTPCREQRKEKGREGKGVSSICLIGEMRKRTKVEENKSIRLNLGENGEITPLKKVWPQILTLKFLMAPNLLFCPNFHFSLK